MPQSTSADGQTQLVALADSVLRPCPLLIEAASLRLQSFQDHHAMSTSANWIWQPDGLGMATLVLSATMGILCILVVATRTWTRYRTGTFAMDDGLMVIGLAAFVACSVFTCLAVYSGLGTVDERLDAWNKSQTTKASRDPVDLTSLQWAKYGGILTDSHGTQNIVFFQITYAWALPFIKSSICLTMLRIITDKPLRITIWVCMIASIVTASKQLFSAFCLSRSIPGWCSS